MIRAWRDKLCRLCSSRECKTGKPIENLNLYKECEFPLFFLNFESLFWRNGYIVIMKIIAHR